MLFGLGEFTKRMNLNEERRKETRKENARLYNEFIRLNPGATTQERLDYANKLIKDTGVGSAGLPTKAQMQSNYNKYKAAEAKKAAAEAEARKEKERQRKIANIRLAGELGQSFSNQYGDEGFDDFLKTQFGDLEIDPSLIPAAKEAAGKKAWNEWQSANQGLISAFIENPTQAGLDALILQGGDVWGERVTNTYKSIFDRTQAERTQAAAQEIEQLRGIKDEKELNAKIELIKKKYPGVVVDPSEVLTAQKELVAAEKADIISKVEGDAIRIAMGATDRQSYNDQIAALIKQYEDEGYTFNFAEANKVIDNRIAKLKEEQGAADARALSQTVKQADALIEEQVKKGIYDADTIGALVEENFDETEGGGRGTKLSKSDKEEIVATIQDIQSSLYAQVETALSGRLDGEGAAQVLGSAKADFIKQFELELQAKGIQDTKPYEPIIDDLWNKAETLVRGAMDEAEDAKMSEVRAQMENGEGGGLSRQQSFNYDDVEKRADTILKVPAITGTDDDTVGMNLAIVKGQVMTSVQNMGRMLDIPVTDNLANEYINQIRIIATELSKTGEAYLLESGELPNDVMEAAFLQAYAQVQFQGNANKTLEERAVSDALNELGLNDITEVMLLNDEGKQEWRNTYAQSREKVRQQEFDIVRGVTVTEDLASSNQIIDSFDGVQSDAEASIQAVKALTKTDPKDFVQRIQGGGPAGTSAMDTISEIIATEDKLEQTYAQIQSEIRRLRMLGQSPIYKQNHEGELTQIQAMGENLNNRLLIIDAQLATIRAIDSELNTLEQAGLAILAKEEEAAIAAGNVVINETIEDKSTRRNPDYTPAEQSQRQENWLPDFFNPTIGNEKRGDRRKR